MKNAKCEDSVEMKLIKGRKTYQKKALDMRDRWAIQRTHYSRERIIGEGDASQNDKAGTKVLGLKKVLTWKN